LIQKKQDLAPCAKIRSW